MMGRLNAHVTRLNRIHESAHRHTAATEQTIERWTDRFLEAPAWVKWVAMALFPLTFAIVALGLLLIIFRWAALFLGEAFAATRDEFALRGRGRLVKPQD